ncbi:MAG: glycosyltransferase family 4 protein [Phycisphaerales bacterium]|nr:MAG: glycosyltransferase family 4 protein [Phycisphaerales bacterium]
MPDTETTDAPPFVPTDVALCIDPEVYRRLRPMLRHLCVGMIDWNASVRLITPSDEVGSLMIGPIQMITYDQPLWPMSHLRSARQRRLQVLVDKLVDRPPTVVHAISSGSFEAAELLAERFDVDLVLQLTAFRDVDALTSVLVEHTDCFIASSQPLLDRLEDAVSVSADQVHLIRPGTLAGPGPTCFSKPGAIPTVLCAESFRPGCGVHHLLRAARTLLDRKREFLAFLTGAGPMESELRKQAHALGLSAAVIFAHPTGSAERIMVGADIFVQPSMDTALTVGPIHALANGMAVIAVGGGAGDYFVDGVTALVLRDASPEALADAIERMLDAPDFAIQLANGGLNHIRNYHPISAMAEQTVTGYQTLAARRRTYSLNR